MKNDQSKTNLYDTENYDIEIIKLADKLAGMDWHEGDEDEEIRQRLKSLTKGLSPQDVQDAVHHASLMAEQRYLRLERFLVEVVMEDNGVFTNEDPGSPGQTRQ